MRFLWPELLWGLFLVPVLALGYVLALRRRKPVAVRYASLSLLRDAIRPGRAWRRHVPPALFLCALTIAILAMARPSATVVLPAQSMTLIMAMDVSRSMLASDVNPTRISAAQAAARSFVEELPPKVRLGIVSFAATAAVVQTPTEDRADLIAAVNRFQLQRGTATGSGLMVALAQLLPEAGFDVESVVFDGDYPRRGGAARDKPIRSKKPDAATPPVTPGSYSNGAIILLSDGRRTVGPDPLEVAKLAADRGVRVYTVGFGSKEGGEIPGFEGMSFYARLDEETLKGVAAMTGAEYFHAGTAAELQKVYQNLNLKIALERKDTEIGALFSAVAAALLLLAATLSLLWFYRR